MDTDKEYLQNIFFYKIYGLIVQDLYQKTTLYSLIFEMRKIMFSVEPFLPKKKFSHPITGVFPTFFKNKSTYKAGILRAQLRWSE